jgi:hypothetical protein
MAGGCQGWLPDAARPPPASTGPAAQALAHPYFTAASPQRAPRPHLARLAAASPLHSASGRRRGRSPCGTTAAGAAFELAGGGAAGAVAGPWAAAGLGQQAGGELAAAAAAALPRPASRPHLWSLAAEEAGGAPRLRSLGSSGALAQLPGLAMAGPSAQLPPLRPLPPLLARRGAAEPMEGAPQRPTRPAGPAAAVAAEPGDASADASALSLALAAAAAVAAAQPGPACCQPGQGPAHAPAPPPHWGSPSGSPAAARVRGVLLPQPPLSAGLAHAHANGAGGPPSRQWRVATRGRHSGAAAGPGLGGAGGGLAGQGAGGLHRWPSPPSASAPSCTMRSAEGTEEPLRRGAKGWGAQPCDLEEEGDEGDEDDGCARRVVRRFSFGSEAERGSLQGTAAAAVAAMAAAGGRGAAGPSRLSGAEPMAVCATAAQPSPTAAWARHTASEAQAGGGGGAAAARPCLWATLALAPCLSGRSGPEPMSCSGVAGGGRSEAAETEGCGVSVAMEEAEARVRARGGRQPSSRQEARAHHSTALPAQLPARPLLFRAPPHATLPYWLTYPALSSSWCSRLVSPPSAALQERSVTVGSKRPRWHRESGASVGPRPGALAAAALAGPGPPPPGDAAAASEARGGRDGRGGSAGSGDTGASGPGPGRGGGRAGGEGRAVPLRPLAPGRHSIACAPGGGGPAPPPPPPPWPAGAARRCAAAGGSEACGAGVAAQRRRASLPSGAALEGLEAGGAAAGRPSLGACASAPGLPSGAEDEASLSLGGWPGPRQAGSRGGQDQAAGGWAGGPGVSVSAAGAGPGGGLPSDGRTHWQKPQPADGHDTAHGASACAAAGPRARLPAASAPEGGGGGPAAEGGLVGVAGAEALSHSARVGAGPAGGEAGGGPRAALRSPDLRYLRCAGV